MRRALALSLLALLALPVPLARAQAQVSDADKRAARDLYMEGYALQQAGKFAEALDRFERSYQVFPAPTTLLHQAECRAALGKLVEAAEDYRELDRMDLGPNPSEAFKQAKSQGAAELAQIEPRIPKVVVRVVPERLPGLVVTIDSQTLNSALIGVPRPVNPGTHKIVAFAPGYDPAEQIVEAREGKTVPVTLQPTPTAGGSTTPPPSGGVVYTPAGGPRQPPPANPGPPPTYVPIGAGATPWQAGHLSKTSILLGGFGGVFFPTETGDFFKGFGTGGVGQGEAGIRVARSAVLGLIFQGGAFSGNQAAQSNPRGSALVTGYFGGYVGFLGAPEGFGFYGDLGLGYRVLSFEGVSRNGFDLEAALGFHIRAAKMLRLVPKAQMFLGATHGPQGDSAAHVLFSVGLAAYWDIDLDRQKPPTGQPQ
jgi:hypothetical protein